MYYVYIKIREPLYCIQYSKSIDLEYIYIYIYILTTNL